MKRKIFFVTGEPSGDLHAGSLLHELYKIIPPERLIVEGTGSDFLKSENCNIFFNSKNLSSVGLTEVLQNLSLYVNLEKELLFKFLTFQPDVVVLVDFPGFNLRLLQKIKKVSPNSKVVYYMPPQVWAWNEKRVHILKKYCDLVSCGLPFEEEFHKKYGVNAFYVGSPIVSELKTFNREDLRQELNINKNEFLIGILPGSRKSEIHFMLETYLNAANLILKEFSNVKFIISEAANIGNLKEREAWKITENFKDKISILSSRDHGNYKLMCASDILMVSSGTATLESALYETPLIIGYRGNLINYFFYLLLRKIKMAGLPNIILNELALPELLQNTATPENYFCIVSDWIKNPEKLNNIKMKLKKLKTILTDKNASLECAKKISEFLL